jgi:hypothetical protein
MSQRKLAASGGLLAAALGVLLTATAQPTRAQGGSGGCVEGGAGPFCAAMETTVYCRTAAAD